MFYACFTLSGSWEGGKNLRVGIFWNKNFFFLGLSCLSQFINKGVSNLAVKTLSEAKRVKQINNDT